MLLYPGAPSENKFKSYLTNDYSKNKTDVPIEMDHQCKMGFVTVLDDLNKLDTNIAESILDLLEL